MMTIEEVERALVTAINAQEADAYAAAARVHWPEALLSLRELHAELENANAEILRRERQLQVADTLQKAVTTYSYAIVKWGPYNIESEASGMFKALELYRELRGPRP